MAHARPIPRGSFPGAVSNEIGGVHTPLPTSAGLAYSADFEAICPVYKGVHTFPLTISPVSHLAHALRDRCFHVRHLRAQRK